MTSFEKFVLFAERFMKGLQDKKIKDDPDFTGILLSNCV